MTDLMSNYTLQVGEAFVYARPYVKLHPAGGWAYCVCLLTDLMSNYTLQVGGASVYVSV